MKQIRDTLEEVGFALEHATSELSRFVLTDYLEPYKAASVKLDILIAHLSAVPNHIADADKMVQPAFTVGNLVTVNQDDYPALGGLFMQLWDGDDVVARVYGNDHQELNQRIAKLNVTSQTQQPAQEPVIEFKQYQAFTDAVKQVSDERAKLNAELGKQFAQEPVSSNEHVKQESKLQRRIDRLVKRLEDYKLKYEGKEKQLTFHAGYDMGYVEGQLSILEELPLPPVVRKNDEPVKEGE
jgi:hypothetical protein